MIMLATISGADLTIAIAGMVTLLVAISIWQAMATGRAGIAGQASTEFRDFATKAEAAAAERDALLAEMRDRLARIEQLLSDVG